MFLSVDVVYLLSTHGANVMADLIENELWDVMCTLDQIVIFTDHPWTPHTSKGSFILSWTEWATSWTCG